MVLPGRLLRISCSSLRMPNASSVVWGRRSCWRLSSKRLRAAGSAEAVTGAEAVVVVAGSGAVEVAGSSILDMYFMYHSSMLLMLEPLADRGLMAGGDAGVVAAGAGSLLLLSNNGLKITRRIKKHKTSEKFHKIFIYVPT
jgi:hypothetical protein